RLRDQYLSKAPYCVDAGGWHVPTLLVGAPGLGRQALAEFLAYLADAEFALLDLATKSAEVNRANFTRLEELRALVERHAQDPGAAGTPGKRLYYVAGIDCYQPGVHGEESANCLWPLRAVLGRLRALGPRQEPGFPFGVVLSAAGDSRLRI